MLWVALILPPSPTDDPKAPAVVSPDAQRGLAMWCLQFTPRVARMEDAVVMEVAASLRLFRGRAALQARLADEAPDLGVCSIGWASTATAALILARCGIKGVGDRLLQAVLDPLPLGTLSAAAVHAPALSRAGVRTLGQLRQLPRGGISRRFGAGVLAALDQAYGLRPEVHGWEALPEDFHARLELPSREDRAPALLMSARPLLMQLCGWLAARHAGATGITLHWVHDSMRARDIGDHGQLTVRTAEPIRELEHFCRLLAEHLAKTALLAPVGELRLEAVGVQALTEDSASLLPDEVRTGETLYLTLERIAARLGPERVMQPALADDHRLEWMTRWQPSDPATHQRKSRPRPCAAPQTPEPTFLLDAPLRLAVRDHRPQYQGMLTLLIGPDRVEGGWWDRLPDDTPGHRNVLRDYWVAVNANAGVLAIFQERLADGEGAWYLHGIYA
ncbi:DNA polymerase Y family protein [Roseateles sp. SL47]|uniref:Y-family DNA polymerase n=1 Tax=Roseateles sp. SL47 TaxID=2995138 RepID=UPI002270A8A1|nr:DNA polymerase Y family protein [Roseateles sp. SL47]WAC72953.1 DNA polymerase Y family protein [Roseateles sp. SL47]